MVRESLETVTKRPNTQINNFRGRKGLINGGKAHGAISP